MNGIGLLVLIVAAGQVTANQPRTQNRDWGWEIDTRNADRALCFIVQLSPTQVAEMQDTGWEYPSDMPAELVGRATRIVFRIGTNLLPQTPSLEEIKQIPRYSTPGDVTAMLGQGRLSDVEPNPLHNVLQDRGTPPLPSFGGGGFGGGGISGGGISGGLSGGGAPRALDPSANLADQAQAATGALAEQLKTFVRGTPNLPDARGGLPATNTNPAGSGAATSPSLPGFAGAAATNKFNQPDTTNPYNDPRAGANGNWQPPSTLPYDNRGLDNRGLDNRGLDNRGLDDRNREDATRMADNRYQTPGNPNGYAGNSSTGQNYGYGQGAYTSGANYDPRDPASLQRDMFNGIPTRQTPGGGFGSFNGGNNSGTTNQTNSGYAQDRLGNPQNQNYNPNDYPNGQSNNNQFNGGRSNNSGLAGDGVSRIADVPPGSSGLPTTGGQNNTQNTTTSGTKPQTLEEQALTKSTKSKDNILTVFFLLSAVVNIYLGMLIRKLLTRYRALLANMRGQTTHNAYS